MGGTDTEESTADSAKYSGEETEDLASEGETQTAGGAGEVGTTATATEKRLGGSGAETVPGGAAAGGGATSDTTAAEADAAGAGSCHRAEKWERKRFSGRRGNPAGKSSGVEDGEGGPKAREWEGGLSRRWAPTPLEWKICPGVQKLWSDP